MECNSTILSLMPLWSAMLITGYLSVALAVLWSKQFAQKETHYATALLIGLLWPIPFVLALPRAIREWYAYAKGEDEARPII